MKTFHFATDCTFEAENIDDAFAKLAGHFLALINDSQGDELHDYFSSIVYIACSPKELQFIGKMEINQ